VQSSKLVSLEASVAGKSRVTATLTLVDVTAKVLSDLPFQLKLKSYWSEGVRATPDCAAIYPAELAIALQEIFLSIAKRSRRVRKTTAD